MIKTSQGGRPRQVWKTRLTAASATGPQLSASAVIMVLSVWVLPPLRASIGYVKARPSTMRRFSKLFQLPQSSLSFAWRLRRGIPQMMVGGTCERTLGSSYGQGGITPGPKHKT
jgi:hypothetical protein